MKYKRESKSRTWRSSAEFDTESEVNDYDPLLSDASVTSRRSFGATIVFPDASETSDFESTRHIPLTSCSWPSTSAAGDVNYRKKIDASDGERLSRFQIYSQMKNFIKKENNFPSMHSVASSVFIPYVPGGAEAKQSSLVTVFAIWNTIMGSSLLAMPWGFAQAGLASGIFILIVMGGTCFYSAYLILRVYQLHGSGDEDWEVSELCGYLIGPIFEFISKVFSIIVLIGAAIVYWILLSNFLFHSVDYIHDVITDTGFKPNTTLQSSLVCPAANKTMVLIMLDLAPPQGVVRQFFNALMEGDPNDSFNKFWSLEFTVPIFLALILFPLINFKSATFFTKFNSFGTMSVIFLLVFIIVKAAGWGFNADFHDENSMHYAYNYKSSFPMLSGTLSLSMFIHNIIITIMRNNANQEKNTRDLSLAFGLVTGTYFFIGVIFYLTFPLSRTCIEDNFLNNFENWDSLTVIARMFLFFQLTTVFPLLVYMLRVQLFTTFMRTPYPGLKFVLLMNVLLVGLCILFAIFLPKIGTIIRFTGSVSGFVYVFTLPILLHIYSLKKRDKLTPWSFFHVFIPIMGLMNLIAQFFM